MAITIPNKLWVKTYGLSDDYYVELTSCIKFNGIKWSRNDIDASTAGRDTQDGLMHRARVAIKARLDVECIPLDATLMAYVLQAIEPQWLTVKFFDPNRGAYREATMYSNNVSATFLKYNTDGTSYWEGLTFPLIEQ